MADGAALYATHGEQIHAYLARRSDPDTADDLAQETFLRALTALRRGDCVDHVSGWLYRIAHNLVIDHYRRRERQPLAELHDNLLSDDPTPALHERVDAVEALRYADRVLTPAQADVMRMRELQGYKYGEIAELAGSTEGAVKALRHRALVNLRAQVRGSEHHRENDQ